MDLASILCPQQNMEPPTKQDKTLAETIEDSRVEWTKTPPMRGEVSTKEGVIPPTKLREERKRLREISQDYPANSKSRKLADFGTAPHPKSHTDSESHTGSKSHTDCKSKANCKVPPESENDSHPIESVRPSGFWVIPNNYLVYGSEALLAEADRLNATIQFGRNASFHGKKGR